LRWRNAGQARTLSWQDVFGACPFPVMDIVDDGDRAFPMGLLLDTELGEREISEVWLELADESGEGVSSEPMLGHLLACKRP
jgi:hypothetical protein